MNQFQKQTPIMWIPLGTIGADTYITHPKQNNRRMWAYGIRANAAGTFSVRWNGIRKKVWIAGDQIGSREILADTTKAEALNEAEGYIAPSPYHNIAAGETRIGMFDKILVTGTTATGIEVAILVD